MQMAIPEVGFNGEKTPLYDAFDIKPQAVGIGPGRGGSNAKALHEFLITNSIPLVIDADAIFYRKTDLGFRCYRRNRY
jgi:NAD(P)H-hydrate repair Nnr-like enzyme with NAD(P)H-hydrate dehydratase domain